MEFLKLHGRKRCFCLLRASPLCQPIPSSLCLLPACLPSLPAVAASSPSTNAARSPPPLNSWRAWAEYGREHQNQKVSKGSPERSSLTNHAALKAAFLTPLPLSPVMQHQKPQQAVSPQTQTPSTWTAHMLAPITFHETLSPTKKKMA